MTKSQAFDLNFPTVMSITSSHVPRHFDIPLHIEITDLKRIKLTGGAFSNTSLFNRYSIKSPWLYTTFTW